MKIIILLSLIFVTSCASRKRTILDYDFELDNTAKKSITLWSTNYYTPIYQVRMSGIPLKDLGENSLVSGVYPVLLTKKEWCYSAMEGSVAIKFPGGDQKTFNYAGTTTDQVDCSTYFGDDFPGTNAVRFRAARSRWGEGVENYSLVPYRTIAVDPNVIPFGSVVYIPKAKGKKFMWIGKEFTHDGFFFAGDKGGAIKGSHIDVFTGNSKHHPFNFIGNHKSKTFQAYLIEDDEVKEDLTRLHKTFY
ncbi:3D domain-containing protein [Halobacteriovorax sp.]|uniref:3D domain-containing protein n=1 Tax=Halobacteriovorax sp. TaxID=2020862 RepID=UPI0035675BB3